MLCIPGAAMLGMRGPPSFVFVDSSMHVLSRGLGTSDWIRPVRIPSLSGIPGGLRISAIGQKVNSFPGRHERCDHHLTFHFGQSLMDPLRGGLHVPCDMGVRHSAAVFHHHAYYMIASPAVYGSHRRLDVVSHVVLPVSCSKFCHSYLPPFEVF